MAFDDVTFPYYPMKHGIKKEIIDPVSIVSNGAYEYRLKRQAWERYKWTLPVQSMTNEQKEDIKSFLLQRSHSLNSFKFVDPDAASFVSARLDLLIGNLWKVNLPLSMFDQSVPGTHPLFNADVDNWTYTVNGFDQGPEDATGSPPTFMKYWDGQPVLQFSAFEGEDVRATGTVHFTVRLNSTLSYALAALNTSNETLGVQHAAIELIEVFGEY